VKVKIKNNFRKLITVTDREVNTKVRKMYQLDANNFIMSWILTDKQCTRLHTNSAGPQPQQLWHNTTCGSETTYKNS